MSNKDLEEQVGKLIWEAASLKPGVPGHAARTTVLASKARRLIRAAQQQAQEDALAMLTGTEPADLDKKHHHDDG